MFIDGQHYRIGFIDGKTRNTILFDAQIGRDSDNKSKHDKKGFGIIKAKRKKIRKRITTLLKRSGANYVHTQFLDSAPRVFLTDNINCGPWILYFASLMLKQVEINQDIVDRVFAQMNEQAYNGVVGIKNIKRKMVHPYIS